MKPMLLVENEIKAHLVIGANDQPGSKGEEREQFRQIALQSPHHGSVLPQPARPEATSLVCRTPLFSAHPTLQHRRCPSNRTVAQTPTFFLISDRLGRTTNQIDSDRAILRARNKAETQAPQSRIPVPSEAEIAIAFERNSAQQKAHQSIIRMPRMLRLGA
jgi:hypothetical protein